MLKYLLIGASTLALAAGTANAANNTTIITSSGNTVNTNQLGATDSSIFIDQAGTGNEANSDQQGATDAEFNTIQNGVNNSVTANQGGSDSNRTDVIQGYKPSDIGSIDPSDENPANFNTATVTQLAGSANNWSYTSQFGDGNTATITQSGDGGNTLDVHNDDPNGGGYNFANIDLEQVESDNTATINQGGDRNRAQVYQGLYPETPPNPLGAPSTGQTQVRSSDRNEARVDQDVGSDDSTTSIFQGRSDNLAISHQTAAEQFVEIRQGGDDAGDGNNEADILQLSAGVTAFILQYGTSNNAIVNQAGDATTFMDLRQQGNQNDLFVDQSGTNANLTVLQTGNQNFAFVRQSAADGQITLNQLNGGNNIDITQITAGSVLDITQTGGQNGGTIVQ